MATKKKQKVVSKEDLRRLMKEKTFSIKTKSKRIEHPLAKYNSLDQLTCKLCNTVIKSEALWVPHIQSRQHKEKVEDVKTPGAALPKRKLSPEIEICNKRQKDNGKDSGGLPADFFDNKDKKPLLTLAQYSSDDEEESDKDEIMQNQLGHPSLPQDYFDKDSTDDLKPVVEEKTMAEVLPEGFFDNPVQDAKVRQVEYKDKMEEEWEMFQKAMKEETHVSEAIVEEEDEQINVDRNIEEIDDQINRWKEVNDLHIKKEEVPHNTNNTNTDSDSDSDDQDLQDFLDWRSKKITIKN